MSTEGKRNILRPEKSLASLQLNSSSESEDKAEITLSQCFMLPS